MTWTRRTLLRRAAVGALGISAAGAMRSSVARSTPVASPVTGDDALLVPATEAMAMSPAPTWLAVMDAGTFDAGFIEGATRINWDEMALTESSDEAISAWEDDMRALFSARGVPPDGEVVAYDEGTLFAARGWWQLAYLGYPAPRVLDGGLPAWREAGGEVLTERGLDPLEAPMSDPGEIRRELLATKDEILASLDDDGVFIVDARSSEEYEDGHIPGAVNVPYTDNAVMKDANVYLPAEELRERYASLGMEDGKRAITYCTTGARGSVAAFALRVAGFRDVALYVPSWGEWSADPEAPVER